MKTPAKPLWEETRDLHHACEEHVVGRAMSTGNPPRVWYAAWLKALHQIHSHIDPSVDSSITRADQLAMDIAVLQLDDIADIEEANIYISSLTDEKSIAGAAYVLTGAHLMGGEIMRRRLIGFPVTHLEWEDRKQALQVLQQYRIRDDITQEARACFYALLRVMDEINLKYPQQEYTNEN